MYIPNDVILSLKLRNFNLIYFISNNLLVLVFLSDIKNSDENIQKIILKNKLSTVGFLLEMQF